MVPKKVLPFLIVNGLIGIAVIGVVAFGRSKPLASNIIKRDSSKEFTFTSPILDCENVNQGEAGVLLYKDVKENAESFAKKYSISSYSIYFRDLNNGPWIGINEKEVFSPASLMKTPILISFLKQVERTPELIKKQVVATDEYFDYSIQQNFDMKTKIIKGNTYTLEQVAALMISESDNVATLMLSKYVDQDDFDSLLKAIGVSIEEKGQDADIRVKDFAGFFRILYNASYLNRQSSEAALRLLSQSTFTSGIVAGVPKGIVVAHKYGERSVEQKQDGSTLVKEKQLHDCGIVYSEPNPYILCVMTRGKDFQQQENFISDISRFIFKQFSK